MIINVFVIICVEVKSRAEKPMSKISRTYSAVNLDPSLLSDTNARNRLKQWKSIMTQHNRV